MHPLLQEGDILFISPPPNLNLAIGDIVAYRAEKHPSENINLVHRYLFGMNLISPNTIYAKADNYSHLDPPFTKNSLIGKVTEVRRNGKRIELSHALTRYSFRLVGFASATQGLLYLILAKIYAQMLGNNTPPGWVRTATLRLIGLPLRFCQMVLTVRS